MAIPKLKTNFIKSKIFLLALFLHMVAIECDVSDEFEIESEFDDGPELGRYLAAQMNPIAESSLPQTNRKAFFRVSETKKSRKEDYIQRNSHKNHKFKKYDDAPKMFDTIHRHIPLWTNTHDVEPAKACSDFPQISNAFTFTTCSSVLTSHGVVNWCEISCRSGYKLQFPLLRYEICGKTTRYRWTFQLMGLNQTFNRCVTGNAVEMESCTTPECFETAAYYLNKIDFSADPCNSFFDFACGRWMKETPVPSFRSYYDAYSSARDRLSFQIADLLAQPVSPSDIDCIAKAKIFYQSCMDLDQIDSLGSRPMLGLLHNEISWPIIDPSWSEANFDFESTVATLRGRFNNKVMMDFSVRKHKGFYVLECLKGKVPWGLKKRDNEKHHDSLVKDIALMLGADPITAEIDVENMKTFERKLAEIKVGSNRCQEKEKFQKLTIRKMKESMPEIDWLSMLKEMIQNAPVTNDTVVLVWNEKYLKALIKLIKKSAKRTVQNFMVWSLVRHRVTNLGSRFLKRLLKHRRERKGVETLRERRHKCAYELIVGYEDPISKLYVDTHFSPSKKEAGNLLMYHMPAAHSFQNKAVELFKYIREGFIHLLETEVKWMDEKTKSYAIKKAMAIKSNVGYNPKVFDNATYLDEETRQLKVTRNDYFGNFIHLLEFNTQKPFMKLGKSRQPLPHSLFRPTTVNAFYGASYNKMYLPSGELQYPFYWGTSYPASFQFGAIGSILGHELTHGFDNYGRKFDLNGELGNWWSASSLKKFYKKTKCMEDQYNNYFWKPADDFIDGAKAVNENIADNGGVRESYTGYHLWLKSRKITKDQIEPATGFTDNQMFFIGYASVRCSKYTHKAAKLTIAKSSHSPGRYRIDGPLQNFKKFSEVFNCPVGSLMNPKKKCVIW